MMMMMMMTMMMMMMMMVMDNSDHYYCRPGLRIGKNRKKIEGLTCDGPILHLLVTNSLLPALIICGLSEFLQNQ